MEDRRDSEPGPQHAAQREIGAADAASDIYLMCRDLEAMAADAGFLVLARRLSRAREAAAEALRDANQPGGQDGREKAADGDAA
ncbi:MAG: hypothetical protein GC189_06150 [Alphaproteobacteria bacterium]|nr:hypothetical protein [Alphaproteobacteria bacterium]